MSSTSTPTQQKEQVRRPAYSDWPTIKIFMPPQGRFSTKTDEWCITYCSQSVSGRYHSKQPACRSFCIRKVFPHEVKNIVAYKRHHEVDSNGKAKYPLPPEGQPVNVPRILGGRKGYEPEDEENPNPSSIPESKNWQEGWYLWTSKSFSGSVEKILSMTMDLQKQQDFSRQQKERRTQWVEYQQYLERHGGLDSELLNQPPPDGQSSKWWGLKIPSRPMPDDSARALLLHIPPDTPPFWERIHKLLTPSGRALEITRESLLSGSHTKFAGRMWEAAWSEQPFVLAMRSWEKACEAWKEVSSQDDEEDHKRRR